MAGGQLARNDRVFPVQLRQDPRRATAGVIPDRFRYSQSAGAPVLFHRRMSLSTRTTRVAFTFLVCSEFHTTGSVLDAAVAISMLAD